MKHNDLYDAIVEGPDRDAFKRLWNNDNGAFQSVSEADLAFCIIARKHTQNDRKVDELYRASQRMRGKWDDNARQGETYGQGTLRIAKEKVGTFSYKSASKDVYADAALLEGLCEYHRVGKQCGESTGWLNFDKFFTVRMGEFTVLTGRPNSGKSEWIDNLITNLYTHHKWCVAFFSPEKYPLVDHFGKLYSKIVNKPFWGEGRLSINEITKAYGKTKGAFTFLYPNEDEWFTVDDILAKFRWCVKNRGCKLFVIDPWNEIEHNYRNKRETDYISDSLSKMRRFVREFKVHLWIVAHPQKLYKNPQGKYDTPTPYNISGSAHWYNKLDNCLCIDRDLKTNDVHLHVQKIRYQQQTGKIGVQQFWFDKNVGMYYDFNGGVDNVK